MLVRDAFRSGTFWCTVRLRQNCTGGAPRPRRRQYRDVVRESAAALAAALAASLVFSQGGSAFSGVVGTMLVAQTPGALMHVLGVHGALPTRALAPLKRMTEALAVPVDRQEVSGRVNIMMGRRRFLSSLSRWWRWTATARTASGRWWRGATRTRCSAAAIVEATGN